MQQLLWLEPGERPGESLQGWIPRGLAGGAVSQGTWGNRTASWTRGSVKTESQVQVALWDWVLRRKPSQAQPTAAPPSLTWPWMAVLVLGLCLGQLGWDPDGIAAGLHAPRCVRVLPGWVSRDDQERPALCTAGPPRGAPAPRGAPDLGGQPQWARTSPPHPAGPVSFSGRPPGGARGPVRGARDLPGGRSRRELSRLGHRPPGPPGLARLRLLPPDPELCVVPVLGSAPRRAPTAGPRGGAAWKPGDLPAPDSSRSWSSRTVSGPGQHTYPQLM